MEPVRVLCYDLTRGFAASLGRTVIGRDVEAIWHTGVLVFGREYFFGNGVEVVGEGQFSTMMGLQASRTLEMGATGVSRELFDAWVADQRTQDFAPSTYHVINHNCNHFTGAHGHIRVGAARGIHALP